MRIIFLACNLAFGSILVAFDLVDHIYVGNHGGAAEFLEKLVVGKGGF